MTDPNPAINITDTEFATFVEVLCVQHVHGHATDSYFTISARKRDGRIVKKAASTRELLTWAKRRIEDNAEKARRFDSMCLLFQQDKAAAFPILQRFCSDQLAYQAALSIK